MLALTLLSGCAVPVLFPTGERESPFEAEALETLIGSTKEEVRQQLQLPRIELELQGKTYFIYQMNTDVAGVNIAGLPFPYWGSGRYCSLLEFDRDQRLKSYETDWFSTGDEKYGVQLTVPPSPNCRSAFWSESEFAEIEQARMAEIERRAHEGDPEAMYEYAGTLAVLDAWRWHCLAAQRGHATARWKMAHSYRSDYLGLEQDLVLAYVWYTLSFEAGVTIAEQYRDRLSQEMIPDQIAEAERLVAEWEPNPAECEIKSDESNAP
jgi:hypothetical protein